MNIEDKIKELAKKEGIPIERFDFKLLKDLQKEHDGHGHLTIQAEYSNPGYKLTAVYINCDASKLDDIEKCPQYNPDAPMDEFGCNIYNVSKKTRKSA